MPNKDTRNEIIEMHKKYICSIRYILVPLFEKVGESELFLKYMRPSSGNHVEEDEGKSEKKKY